MKGEHLKKEEAKVTLRNYVQEFQQIHGCKTLLKTYPYSFYLGALTYASTSEDIARIKESVFRTLQSPSQSF